MAGRARNSLRRDLGILGNFAFAYGDVSEGIYFTLGIVLVYASAAATYAYLFATVAYVLTALCYAELSSAYHQAGGAFTFASRAFGKNVAFLAGWALMLDYLVTTAISSVAAVGYVGYFFPALTSVATEVTVLVVLALLALNIVGIAGSARFSYILVLFDIVGIAIVLAIGFIFSYNPALNPAPHFGTSPTAPDFLYAVTIAMSSYLGIEVVSQSAGETRKAGTNIPRAVLLISGTVVVSTLAVSALALGVVPLQVLQNSPSAISYPVSFIASMLPFGWVMGGLTAVLGITVLLVAANAGVVGISRLAYAMSEAGAIPGFFGRIHHRYGTPYLSVAAFAAIAMAIVVGFSAQLGVLAEMYNFGALLAYMIVGLSLIQLRNKEKSLVRPFKTPWSISVRGRKPDADGKIRIYEVPILAVGAFVADLIIWSLVVLLHPVGREVGALWVLLGLMVYYVYSRVRRRKAAPSVAVNFGVFDGQAT